MSMDVQKLYLMKNELGLYKVGISKSPKKRARDISNTSGFNTHVVRVWDVYQAFQLEQSIHVKFTDKRKKGEWFDFSEDDLGEVFSFVKENYNKIPCVQLDCVISSNVLFCQDPLIVKFKDTLKYEVHSVEDMKDVYSSQLAVIKIFLEHNKDDELSDFLKSLKTEGYTIPVEWCVYSLYKDKPCVLANYIDSSRGVNYFNRKYPIYKGEKVRLLFEMIYDNDYIKDIKSTLNAVSARLQQNELLYEEIK